MLPPKAKKYLCQMRKCGAVAKFKTTVEVNVFRGDDEVIWSCNEHKKDCSFLVDWQGGAA
ncbi:hypothetical protein DVH14_18090 [Escherichia coli]|nr:hypothetical protein [Escherichia coli]AXH86782.1 hypothetical protein DVH14_18090 [Escherichia coli]